ncbi:hypothetical protein G4Y79_20630 [Phototrophicus methaneseepsis]|uniref:Replication initiation factor n=1 Tax=Phototrophicus methaneseepsis TaxID=2710758 RepID=A0A7S8ID05_9CHLR|nr:hypothetical protein [Phototrophicus methaneseepsis]QPC82065.1 hypothetical protein G4Y79_20630 [Phototrophicus methaneseepsis]
MKKHDFDNPRTVSRGLKVQPLHIGLDSLYLLIEYPHIDLFHYWKSTTSQASSLRLRNGIVHEDFVIRGGVLGYKLTIWDGDARLLITDRVEETLIATHHAGEGMGAMLQLGPKWLMKHGNFSSSNELITNIHVQLKKFKISSPQDYPIRINRIDIALDVFGLAVKDFIIDEWRHGWVGRASGKHFYDENEAGNLSGFSVGSSEGAVRFKVYDKVLESKKKETFGFWASVWNWEILKDNAQVTNELNIARFEWSIKPFSAKFTSFQYLSDYSFDGLKQIMNYVVTQWGRLCIISENPKRSRWETHPLWTIIRRMMIDAWDIDHVGNAKREYHFTPDLTQKYTNSLTGWIAGMRARAGLELGYDQPADLDEALKLAEKHNRSIDEKAKEKFAILLRLSGKRPSQK